MTLKANINFPWSLSPGRIQEEHKTHNDTTAKREGLEGGIYLLPQLVVKSSRSAKSNTLFQELKFASKVFFCQTGGNPTLYP